MNDKPQQPQQQQQQQSQQQQQQPQQKQPSHINEEPEVVQEESVPLDGKDEKGEKMMEELGRNKPGPKLRDEPGED